MAQVACKKHECHAALVSCAGLGKDRTFGLMVRDVAASIQFYELLGFASVFTDSPIDPKYAGVRRDGVVLHLQWHAAEDLSPGDRPTVGNDEFVREGEPDGYRLYFGPDGPTREVRILGMGMMSWYGRRQ